MTITLIAPAPKIYKLNVRGEKGPAGPPGDGTTTIGDITGLQTALDGKAATSHTHTIANVTGLQTAIDAKADASATTSALAGKAASSHTHPQSEITNLVTDLAGKAASSHTHSIGNVTGLQTALDGKADGATTTSALALKADLVGGYIPSSQIPAIAITEYLGSVANEAAMLALIGDQGDWCIRTDSLTAWVLSADDSSLLASWIQIPHPQSPVLSVNDQTGVITLDAADVGAQPLDATLTAIAALTTAADKLIYATGSDAFSTCDLSSFARTLIDDADAATARTTLGAQPLDATLTAIAALTTAADKLIYATGSDAFSTCDLSAFARTLLDDADAATARTTLGASSNVGSNGCHIAAPTTGQVIYWTAKSRLAFTINGVYGIRTTAGTATVAIKINGTSVGGLSAISVTTTPQDVAATSGNTVAVGDEVTVEVTTASGATHLRFTLQDTQ
jgi:hypothetical protein